MPGTGTETTIHFWGTRGSIPTPGRSTEKYGGNTPCLEVRHGDTRIIVDAGSGIREMSTAWRAEDGGQPREASLLLTHLHWDHIQGFPFFNFGYDPKNALTVYGEAGKNVENLLSGQMAGDYFPVEISAMRAAISFRGVSGPFEIAPFTITPFPLPHPGGSLGYRLEADDAVLVVATDGELDHAAVNRDAVAADPLTPREYPEELLDAMRGATLLVVDCQYTDDMYRTRDGWGHNSVATVVDLCRQLCPDMVALFHHDPQSSDEQVTRIAEDVERRLDPHCRRTLVFAAREGLSMRLATPKPPPKLHEA